MKKAVDSLDEPVRKLFLILLIQALDISVDAS